MVNEKIRAALQTYGEEFKINFAFLDNEAYDSAIIGVTESGNLIYDYDLMVEDYVKANNCDIEEAIIWIDYKTMRAIPYMGENRPIIIKNIKSILEIYGG